jgi:pullulanase
MYDSIRFVTKRGGFVFHYAAKVNFIIHYFRFQADYDDWDVWAWPDNQQGKACPFVGMDDFGSYAYVDLESTDEFTKAGFLLRRRIVGNEWAEREFTDRYIENFTSDGLAEVWVIEGDPILYYNKVSAMHHRKQRVRSAVMVLPSRIRVIVNPDNLGIAEQLEHILLYRNDGSPVQLQHVCFDNENTIDIETNHPLHIAQPYHVMIPGYPPARVSIQGLFDHPSFENAFTYPHNDLGVTYSASCCQIRLWSPTAMEARVAFYLHWNDEFSTEDHAMSRSIGGTWYVTIAKNMLGAYYTFKVRHQEQWYEAVDPYAKALSVNSLKGMIVNMQATNPPDWNDDCRPHFVHPVDAIIYELHIRDATTHISSGALSRGTYLGLCESGTTNTNGNWTGLDYYKNLGVTHVQLLPVTDYISVDEENPQKKQYNWGYDPAHFFAPEGSYSTDPYQPMTRIQELKQLIQTFHQNGIRIVMDVVFNHMFSATFSNLGRLVPNYYFRCSKEGVLSNGTGVGNDTASERIMMRKLIVDCVEYWTREYHIDGFRFDLMGIHDIQTMNEVRQRLDHIDPSLLVYGEGWNLSTMLSSELKANLSNAQSIPNIGQFHDTMRDALKGGVFRVEEQGFVNGQGLSTHGVWQGIVGGIGYNDEIPGFAGEPAQTINYVEVHDNHTLWDRLFLSNPEHTIKIRMQMHRLATSIILLSQGIPFLHAGQEWFRTKNGEHNSYRSSDAVNAIDWDYAFFYKDNIDYVRGLIALRKAQPLFRLRTASLIKKSLQRLHTTYGVIAYVLSVESPLDEAYRTIVVAHNSQMFPVKIGLPQLLQSSQWEQLCDGQRAGTKPFAKFYHNQGFIEPLSTAVWGNCQTIPVTNS